VTAHASLVEQCLLRPWPGNVRELLVEVRAAGAQAIAKEASRVHAQHLAPSAGRAFAPAPAEPAFSRVEPARKRMPIVDAEWKVRIEEALREHGGNVSASARSLGLHRNQLRRLLERHGIDTSTLDDTGDDAQE
jgi:transcriptional regulator with GAF, ATPase, and Fis domain